MIKSAGLSWLALTLMTFLMLPRRTFWGLFGLTLSLYALIISFFRQPWRHTPITTKGIVAPADGTIVAIENVRESEYFGDERIMISIFLSLFDVHMNWIPIDGKVIYQQYHPGQYLVALHPKSSELNERNTIVIESKNGVPILVRQIAGLIARRICWYVERDQPVNAGDELGFIKFGSRVDIFLPTSSKIKVAMYQRMIGGETILAEV